MLIHSDVMTKIQSRLYLGTLWNVKQLLDSNPQGITHVLNCTDDDCLERELKDLTYVRLGQLDGHEFAQSAIRNGLDFIRNGLCKNGKVLVCCHAGVSRSASMMIAFLYTTGLTWDEAKAYVQDRRSIVSPHSMVEASFKKAFGLLPLTACDLIQA